MAGCASPKGVVTTTVGRLQRTGTPQILHNRNFSQQNGSAIFKIKIRFYSISRSGLFFTQNNHSQSVIPSSKVQDNDTEENRHFQQPPTISICLFFHKKHTNSPIFRQISPQHTPKYPLLHPKNAYFTLIKHSKTCCTTYFTKQHINTHKQKYISKLTHKIQQITYYHNVK